MKIHFLIISLFIILSQGFTQSVDSVTKLKKNSLMINEKKGQLDKKFNQARALEKAGLWDEAEKLYREINTDAPGNSRYFSPFKSMLRQKRDWESLTQFMKLYIKNKPKDKIAKLDMAEVYIWADSTSQWQTIFNELINDHPNNQNVIKLIINKLMGNGKNEFALSLLDDFREESNDPDFYSLEVGGFFSMRMMWESAMKEYTLYLSINPDYVNIVSDRILTFPDEKQIQDIVHNYLDNLKIPEAGLILSDLDFKSKQYIGAFNRLKTIDAVPEEFLELGKDLMMVNKYELAESVFNHILNSDASPETMKQAIFQVAQVFEQSTTQSLYLLPISGFYRGNPFFNSPYLRVDETRSDVIWKAVSIYDSLRAISQSASADYRLGEIKFRLLNDLDGARSHYENAIKKSGKRGEYLYRSQLRIADILIAKGNLNSAEEMLEKFLRLNPQKSGKFSLIMKLGQVYMYDGKMTELDSLLNPLIKEMAPDDPYFNEIIEISSLLKSFRDSSDLFSQFSEIQLSLMQNKRSEALGKMGALLASEKIEIVNMALYQSAYLHLLQNEIIPAIETAKTITGDSIYAELAMIFIAEVEDHVNENYNNAVDIYLQFLEEYPASIFYDDIRLRLRELAS